MAVKANTKMSKIIVEKFDVRHKFMKSCFQHILQLSVREFVDLTHVVSCNELVIFVLYDKKTLAIKFNNLFEI